MKKYLVIVIALGAIVFIAYEVLIYYDNNFRPGRMWETPAIKPHEEKIPEMTSGTIPFDGGEAVYRSMKGVAIRSPLQDDDPHVIKLGKGRYFTYCAQCHGKYHDGNGTVGQSFSPLPGDLRSEKVQSMLEGVMFKDVSYGRPGGRQPPLASTIEIIDRWRIIAYVKSLGTR